MRNVLSHILSMGLKVLGLFPAGAAGALSRALADIWFLADRRRRTAAINNLTYVFGNEKSAPEIRIMARQVFAGFVSMFFEIGRSFRCPYAKKARKLRVEGLQHLSRACGKGKGVLLLSGHMGSWELLPEALGMAGFRMNMVYRPLKAETVNSFVEKVRESLGAGLLPKKKSIKSIMQSLKNREVVAILPDQNTTRGRAVFADFFGKPASTDRGLALLAMKRKAPVIPVFLVREKNRYCLVIRPEIPTVRTGDRREDVRANTRNYNRAVESIIRRFPEQWFWVHRRWKTRPLGEAEGSPGK